MVSSWDSRASAPRPPRMGSKGRSKDLPEPELGLLAREPLLEHERVPDAVCDAETGRPKAEHEDSVVAQVALGDADGGSESSEDDGRSTCTRGSRQMQLRKGAQPAGPGGSRSP